MNVLIVENETYLAQNIASKLSDSGHVCFITSSVDEATKREGGDLLLLSTNTVGQNYKHIIERHRDSIIILMVSYVSEDTVSRPLRMGAKDYIIKPFIMDELLRKIKHYKRHRELVENIKFFGDYFSFVQNELQIPDLQSHNLPVLIKANSQRSADVYAMKYAMDSGVRFKFLNLRSTDWSRYDFEDSHVYYITNCESLKEQDKLDFLDFATSREFVISMISDDKVNFPHVEDITGTVNNLEIGNEILSVKEYERIVIAKFESRYSDIELAKKLGISRKSLWEKRKRYGISKKK